MVMPFGYARTQRKRVPYVPGHPNGMAAGDVWNLGSAQHSGGLVSDGEAETLGEILRKGESLRQRRPLNAVSTNAPASPHQGTTHT